MKPQYTPLAFHFRATTERFWHITYLEHLVEDLRFSSEAAALVAHIGLEKRRAQAYAG